MKALIFIKILFWITVFLIQKVYSECIEEDNLYQCEGEKKCIPLDWLCDRAKDCLKGDDEFHVKCGSKEERGECEAFHFECIDPHSKKKKCVRFEWKCDGTIDCENAIDEVNCEPPESNQIPFESFLLKPSTTFAAPKCKPDEFECKKSGECIERDKVCDDKIECKDGTDESKEKCSIPPILPLIQPNLKQIELFESNNKTKNYGSKNQLITPTTISTTLTTRRSLTAQNLSSISKENVKDKVLENSKSYSTISTTIIPKFFTQPNHYPSQSMIPINAHQNFGNTVKNSVLQIKPAHFTTPSPIIPLIFTNTAYSTSLPPPTITPTTTPTTMTSIKSSQITLLNTLTKTTHFFNSDFFKPKHEKSLPVISAEAAALILKKEGGTKTTEKPFQNTYKMSAEAIKKEKPQRFSANSQSNILSSFFSTDKMEPIHPIIGTPIIPVNRFQLIIPLFALKNGESSFLKETKNVGNLNNEYATTVIPIK